MINMARLGSLIRLISPILTVSPLRLVSLVRIPIYRPLQPVDFRTPPPAIAAITGTFLGISPDLKTPYSIILNADYSRELPGKVTLEVGLYRKAFTAVADGRRRVYASSKITKIRARESRGSKMR